jgi:hypothetical protein
MAASALAVVGVVAGCSGSSVGGTPSAAGGSSSPADSSAPSDLHGAPKVPHPLDTTKFQKDPCSMLTAAQLQQLHDSMSAGTMPQLRNSSAGPGCFWGNPNNGTDTTVSVALLTAGDGLSMTFQNKGDYHAFEQLPDIQGYPAIVAMHADGRNQGQCAIQVGVTDHLVMSVQVGVSNVPLNGQVNQYYKQPCTPAQQAAAAAMTTLRGGS